MNSCIKKNTYSDTVGTRRGWSDHIIRIILLLDDVLCTIKLGGPLGQDLKYLYNEESSRTVLDSAGLEEPMIHSPSTSVTMTCRAPFPNPNIN